MALDLTVGFLADANLPPEAADELRAQFALVNDALAEAGLPSHREPEATPGLEPWIGRMWGYDGLHYARRLAVHLAYGNPLPEPGNDESCEDPLAEQYLRDIAGPGPGVLGRLFGRRKAPTRMFDHLLMHGDAEGFYVPIDFPHALIPESVTLPGIALGSSVALLRECNALATQLGIPADAVPESKAVWDAAERQGQADGWLRYGVESFTILQLREAARRSVASGAAIMFA